MFGEGNNAGHQHFHLCPKCLKGACFGIHRTWDHLLKSQKRPTGKVFGYKIQVNPIHTIFKNMVIIMTL